MVNFKSNFFELNSNQKKRIKKNIFSGFASEGVQVLSQIIFAPLMLFFWGIENFGMWVFLLSIPNIFLIFNINFTDVSIQEITLFNSKGKKNKANEIFQNSIVIIFLNILFFSILILFFYFFNDIDFLILKDLKTSEISIILFFLISSIYIKLLSNLFTIGLCSEGKLYIDYNITSISDLLMKITIVFSGILFSSLIYPAIIFFLYTLGQFFLNFYFFSITNKNLYFSFKLVSKKVLKRLFKLSIGHTADIITSIIKHSGVIFILGIFYDPYTIGYIATIKTLFYFFPIRFFGKLNHITLYEIASLYAKKKYSLIKKNLLSFIKIIIILLTVYFLISILLGPYVYSFWLNNKYELNSLFLLIIIFDVVFFVMRQSIITTFKSINKYVLLGTSELVINIVALILFFLILYFGYSYLVSFAIILFASFISLFFAIIISFLFLKKKYYK